MRRGSIGRGISKRKGGKIRMAMIQVKTTFTKNRGTKKRMRRRKRVKYRKAQANHPIRARK